MANGAQSKEALFERVDRDLTLHPPTTNEVSERMDRMREAAKHFSYELIERGTPSRELSSALTKVEEALFHGIASIARYQ